MSESNVDLLVVGGGPGGYVAAIRGAQLGLSVGLVEKGELGGTCLNVGCIPSKALLHSTELLAFARERGSAHGLIFEGLSVDLHTMMGRKRTVVEQLRQGIESLMGKNRITVYRGLGVLEGAGAVRVENEDGAKRIRASHIILATGSRPVELPFLPFDGRRVVSSDHAIAFETVPSDMVVIGAGAIGLELGSVWSRMGSRVTVVEMLPQIAAGFDKDIAKQAQKIFERQGLAFRLGARSTGFSERDGKGWLAVEKDGSTSEIQAEKVLVAVGRQPNTEGLGVAGSGLELDGRGRIVTDERFRTNLEGIYAIGDVREGPMLAHKAEDEGVACVEGIVKGAGHVNYGAIPGVVYTDPEMASVGLSETEAKERDIPVAVGKFRFAANGRAIASDSTEGLVKVVAHAANDRLLGVQIVAHNAGELISEAVTHLEYGGSAEDLARTVHAHPTLSEALKEAAMSVGKWSIHG